MYIFFFWVKNLCHANIWKLLHYFGLNMQYTCTFIQWCFWKERSNLSSDRSRVHPLNWLYYFATALYWIIFFYSINVHSYRKEYLQLVFIFGELADLWTYTLPAKPLSLLTLRFEQVKMFVTLPKSFCQVTQNAPCKSRWPCSPELSTYNIDCKKRINLVDFQRNWLKIGVAFQLIFLNYFY